MLRGLGAALAKDLRLLARDRVGLVFLGAAPIVVISVAGLSLATLYGAEPRGGTAPVVPLADEDGGWVGRAVRERLADEPSVRMRPVATAAAARALVQAKRAPAALVVPAGTSDAVGAGHAAALVLLSDPVRTVDVAYVRGLAQELRHGLEAAAVERAQHDLDAARAQAADARARVARAADEFHRALDDLGARLETMRPEDERRRAAAERELRTALAERQAAARARLAATLTPLRAFLAELAARRQAFAEWLAAVRERAGRLADRLPPPPEPPSVPPALEELASADPDATAARLVAPDGAAPMLPPVEPPTPPALPAFDLPSLPEPRGGAAPRLDRDHDHGGGRRLLVADRPRARLDAARSARLPDHLGDGGVQRPDDPPAAGRRGARRDGDAARPRGRLPGGGPAPLPPSRAARRVAKGRLANRPGGVRGARPEVIRDAHAARRDPRHRLDHLAAGAGRLAHARRPRRRRDHDRGARRRRSGARRAEGAGPRSPRPAELLLRGHQPQQAEPDRRCDEARGRGDRAAPRRARRRVRAELPQGRGGAARARRGHPPRPEPAPRLRERQRLRARGAGERRAILRLPRARALRDHVLVRRARRRAARHRGRHRRPDGRDHARLRHRHGPPRARAHRARAGGGRRAPGLDGLAPGPGALGAPDARPRASPPAAALRHQPALEPLQV